MLSSFLHRSGQWSDTGSPVHTLTSSVTLLTCNSHTMQFHLKCPQHSSFLYIHRLTQPLDNSRVLNTHLTPTGNPKSVIRFLPLNPPVCLLTLWIHWQDISYKQTIEWPPFCSWLPASALFSGFIQAAVHTTISSLLFTARLQCILLYQCTTFHVSAQVSRTPTVGNFREKIKFLGWQALGMSVSQLSR